MQLIDPKMSIDTIRSYIEVWDCKGCLPYGGTQHNVMAVDDLLCLPTIEAEPVRHGQWLPVKYEHDTRIAKCSICGFWQKSNGNDKTGNYNIHKAVYKYCAACGARMDGGADNEKP